jgi:hypothetical protein
MDNEDERRQTARRSGDYKYIRIVVASGNDLSFILSHGVVDTYTQIY